MGKAARRANIEARKRGDASQFVCGHCPGVRYAIRETSNEARKDWERHNHSAHNGSRRNGFRLRNVTDEGFQELNTVKR